MPLRLCRVAKDWSGITRLRPVVGQIAQSCSPSQSSTSGMHPGFFCIWLAEHERLDLTANVFMQDSSRDLVIRGSQDTWVIARQVGSGRLLMALENGADSNLLEVSRRADALSVRLLMDRPV